VLALAEALGYFHEQRIDFQEVEFASTAEALPALATGQIDAGSTSPTPGLYNAFARGVRIIMALGASEVEPNGNGFPLMSRVGPRGPVIRELSDLRGKRIGQNQRGVISEWALDRALGSVGLQLDDIEIVVMSFPDQIVALGTGGIDGTVIPEPFGTTAEQRGAAVRVLNTDEYIPGGQVAVMLFSDQFAHERTDVARRFSVAYLKAVRHYMDAMQKGHDREAVVGILSKTSGVPAQVIDQAGYFPFRRDGRVNVDTVQGILDYYIERGYVPQRPDIATLLDVQFADHAGQTLGAP
jgi:NitT/TauT family transport system substrate-binding protein